MSKAGELVSKFLVTGGAGFIGSATAARLMAEGHDVVVVDSFNKYYDPTLKRDRVAALMTRVVSPDETFFFESGVRVRSDVAVFPKSPALFLADFGDDFIKCLVIFTSGVFSFFPFQCVITIIFFPQRSEAFKQMFKLWQC